VKGIVRDRATKQPLLANIELINLKANETESLVASDSLTGKYLMILTQGSEYALYVNKKGYLFRSLNFNYSEIGDFQPITLDIELDRATEGTIAVLQNIFFEVDKFDLQDKSRTELQKISRFLNDNPSIRVEISGHTDNVGAPAYNKQLSEKRAQSVFQYLVNTGIDPKRLITKGYGQERPVSSNETEEGKKVNRRIEFEIIK
jgi:outer membrane protein OmpA-like peptidoglycan-associated protein